MIFFKQTNNPESGFGLIEMMVVIAIVGLISTSSVANIRQGDNIVRLDSAALIIISKMEQVKSNALSGKSSNTVRGHGVQFISRPGLNESFIVYTDTFLLGGAVCDADIGEGQINALPDDIVVKYVYTNNPFGLVAGNSRARYCFLSNSGVVYYNGVLANADLSMEIVLEDTRTKELRILNFNSLGLLNELNAMTPPPAVCGNGVYEIGEDCDAGTGVPQDSAVCDKDCTFPICRDNYKNTKARPYADGNGKLGSPLSSTVSMKEKCDDGNAINGGDSCTNLCQIDWLFLFGGGIKPNTPPNDDYFNASFLMFMFVPFIVALFRNRLVVKAQRSSNDN